MVCYRETFPLTFFTNWILVFSGIEIDDSLDHPFAVESAALSPYHVDGDTSPKPITKHPRESKNSTDKRPTKLIHHSNKGNPFSRVIGYPSICFIFAEKRLQIKLKC